MHFDRRLTEYLKQVQGKFIASISWGVLVSAAIIAQAYFLSLIIDRVFLKKFALQQVLPLLYGFALASILRAGSVFIQKKYAAQVSWQIKQTLRQKLMTHLIRLGPAYLKSQKTGELTNTLITGVDSLDAYFSQYLPQLFLATMIPFFILLTVFPLDILSGIVLLFTAPLIPIFMILIGNIAQTLTQKQWKVLSRMSAYFLEVLQGMSTLKLFGRSRDRIQAISKISDEFRTITMKVLRVAFLSALTLEIVATISTAIIAVEVGLRLLYGKMIFQEALFILILAPEFYLPMRLLGTHYHAGMEGISAASRIFEILERSSRTEFPNILQKPPFQEISLSLKDVGYSYPHSRRVALQHINLKIEAGEVVALAGPSGAGKSTLTYLLLRFMEPQQGVIRANGIALPHIDIRWWRKHVSWISQRPYLFFGTILDNIRMAKPDASREEIEEALYLAKVNSFTESLADGYDTLVGEKGIRLSGGQLQRIALARAFLKNAPLLILDEPTSNLDPRTEKELYDSLNLLLKNKTCIVVAHRLGTLQRADRVVFLSEGKIVEEGAPDLLIAQKGYYWKLFQSMQKMQVQ